MLLAASPQGLAGVWFQSQRHGPDAAQLSQWPADASHPVLQAAVQQLEAYFQGHRQAFDLPLDLSAGTAFQQRVWQALLGITHGQTRRYGELAQQIGQASATRAVAAAIGRNPLSIVVPCHRVLGANGSLTGYAGGLDRKAALLERERSAPA
jgi:methylated-DNA-[protein]-cysteine S-methyltransferase